MAFENAPLLEVRDLSISFRMYNKKLEQQDMQVITQLSIDVRPGEIVAIAGSSGSGKSLLAHGVMGLLPQNATMSGEILYKGKAISQRDKEALRGREIALVPQSVTYLDPSMPVGAQVAGGNKSGEDKEKQRSILSRLRLEESVERLYPFQLSGGMVRRILVSTALLSGAELIIADEPTPGMDAELAADALQCFRQLADEGKGVLLITHEIDLAFKVADRVAVFYAGSTLEIANSEDFIKGPEALRHPYSRALWNALPENGFTPIPGFQPYGANLPKGCLFGPRCPYKTEECERPVPMRELRGGSVRCIHGT